MNRVPPRRRDRNSVHRRHGRPAARPLFGSDRVLTFDPIADGLESDELLFDSYDLMARMAHTHYLEQHAPLPAGVEPENPTHEWPTQRVLASLEPRTRRVRAPEPCSIRIYDREPPRPHRHRLCTRPGGGRRPRGSEHERWRSFMTRCGWSYRPAGRTRSAGDPTSCPGRTEPGEPVLHVRLRADLSPPLDAAGIRHPTANSRYRAPWPRNLRSRIHLSMCVSVASTRGESSGNTQ